MIFDVAIILPCCERSILIVDGSCEGKHEMATQTNPTRTQKTPQKGPQKSNQQKNGVRFALATAATIVTLFGAQTLAFAGKTATTQSTTAAQAQSGQTTDTTTTQLYQDNTANTTTD